MNSLKSKDFSSISWTYLRVDTTIWSYLGFQSCCYGEMYVEAFLDLVVGGGVAVEFDLHLGEFVGELFVQAFQELVGCLFLELHWGTRR